MNGARFEKIISAMLLAADYREIDCNGFIFEKSGAIPYFSKHPKKIFFGMYGTHWTPDFIAWHPSKYPDGVIIEVKYQNIGGSVDEKLPYVIGSLKQNDMQSILIVEGDGFRLHAIKWCMAQQSEKIKVFNGISPFISACNVGLF